ncbi:putative oxidoreductase domain protein [Vibrio parahaemolyticus V-223/04]|nr:putative oxidoreductase domain protein [Vibrio parahaemolyticus V-223/04]
MDNNGTNDKYTSESILFWSTQNVTVVGKRAPQTACSGQGSGATGSHQY